MPIMKTDKVFLPWDKISLDIIGPFQNISSKGHRYVLTMVNIASRWPEAILLNEITATAVCDALIGLVARFGFPKLILSDNGTQFRSTLTRDMTKLLSIDQAFVTIYRGDGMAERQNAVGCQPKGLGFDSWWEHQDFFPRY